MKTKENPTIHSPTAISQTTYLTHHGDTRIDAYRWLQDKNLPETIAYLNAENHYTDEITQPAKSLANELFQEITERIPLADSSVPWKEGQNYYYFKTHQDDQYPRFLCKHNSLDAPETLLIDENLLAQGFDYFEVGCYELNHNQSLLAYTVDTSGEESYTLYIMHTLEGTLLQDRIPNVSAGVVFAPQHQALYYLKLDPMQRPYQCWRHIVGRPWMEDCLMWHEKDERFWLEIELSLNKDYILLTAGSKNTTEVYYLATHDTHPAFQSIYPRRENIEYYVEPHEKDFYILTNENAKNFRLAKIPIDQCTQDHEETIIAHDPEVTLEGIIAFENHLVMSERKEGLTQVHVINLQKQTEYYIDFPDPIYEISAQNNNHYNTHLFRFEYSSLVRPDTVYDFDLNTQQKTQLKQAKVLDDFNPTAFIAKRVKVTASDGAHIPVSLVYAKDLSLTGRNPLILEGYGAYGESSATYFSYSRLSLLNRGFIVAIAHIRGGGELGETWYDGGKHLKKKNSFTDFIACAEYLIDQQYTSPQQLIISGASAGGLLVGACANMRPDLFGLVIAEVPFVDPLNTMLDPSLPLTITEYDEWGNPNIAEDYHYIKSYSPYENVIAQPYPAMLITAHLHDTRVPYWESAKWVAKLRKYKTDDHIILLKTYMNAGHGGASGRFNAIKETTFIYAWMIYLLT